MTSVSSTSSIHSLDSASVHSLSQSEEEDKAFDPPEEKPQSPIVQFFLNSFPDITDSFKCPILQGTPCFKVLEEKKDTILLVTMIVMAIITVISLVALFFMPAAAVQVGFIVTALVAGTISLMCTGSYLKRYFQLLKVQEQVNILNLYNDKLKETIAENFRLSEVQQEVVKQLTGLKEGYLKENETFKASNLELSDQLKEQKATIEEMRTETGGLRTTAENLRKTEGSLRTTNNQLTGKIEIITKEKSDLTLTIKKLEQRIAEVKRYWENISKEQVDAHQKVIDSTMKLEKLNAEIEKKQKDDDAIRKELYAKMQADEQAHAAKLEAARSINAAEIEALSRQVQAELAAAKDSRELVQARNRQDIEQAQKNIQQLEETRKALKEQENQLVIQIDARDKELKKLIKDVEEASNRLQNTQDSLHSTVDQLNSASATLTETINKTLQEQEKLKQLEAQKQQEADDILDEAIPTSLPKDPNEEPAAGELPLTKVQTPASQDSSQTMDSDSTTI